MILRVYSEKPLMRSPLSISLSAWLVLLAFTALPASPGFADPDCVARTLTETLGNARFQVTDVSGDTKDDRLDITNLFGAGDHVLLGINPRGHSYLLAGNVRYDGNIFTHFGRVKSEVTQVSDGTVILFKNLQPEVVERLKKQLSEKVGQKVWSSSCFSGACSQLASTGIQLASGKPLLPTSIFKRIFENGFVDASGQPIPMEIFRTNETSVEQIFQYLNHKQTSELLASTRALAVFVVFGGSVYLVIRHFDHAHPLE
jgi:hypothetical protein